MSHWPYIIAAYAITILATLALAGWSWWRMKRAEAQAEALRRP